MSLLKKCRLSPVLCLFFSFVLLTDAIFITDVWIIFLVIYFSVFIHEVAHALTAMFFGHEVKLIKLTAYGGYAQFTTHKWLDNNRHRFHIAVAGPLSNLLLSVIFNYINQPFWAELNLTFALFNLIPVLPMDGAHILAAVINKYTENKFITPVIGVIAGSVAAAMFASTNFAAAICLAFFVITNMFYISDLILHYSYKPIESMCKNVKEDPYKGEIIYLEKERIFIPVGMDRNILHIAEQANKKLDTENENVCVKKIIQEVIDDWFADEYELEIKVVK